MSDLRKAAASNVLKRQREERAREIDAEAERLRLEEEQRRLGEQQAREREEAVAAAREAVPQYMTELRGFLARFAALEEDFGRLRAVRDEAAGAVSSARSLGARDLPDLNPDVGPSMSFDAFLQTASMSLVPDDYNAWSREIDRARKERSK